MKHYKPIFTASSVRKSLELKDFLKYGDVSLGDTLTFPKYEEMDIRQLHDDSAPLSPYRYYINIYKNGKPYWLLVGIKYYSTEYEWVMINRLGRLLDEYSITEREKWNSPMKTLEKFYGNTIVL